MNSMQMAEDVTKFPHYYAILVATLMSENSDYDMNQRTKMGIAFLPEGYSFAMHLQSNVLPTCGLRLTRPYLAAAEAAWCFMGHTNLSWLSKYTKIWQQFADKNGNIMEAYGYRWRHAFGYDQLQTAMQRLMRDPSDRRIWVSSWDPGVDLRDNGQKTVPCPVGFTLSVHERRLNSTLMIRSSDVFIGLPLDVMRHALVMRAIANSMDLNMGYMRVTLAHPHIYESHWDTANMMLEQEVTIPDIKMPLMPWTVEYIVAHPDDYMTMISGTTQSTGWPKYDPRPTVVK